MGDAKNFDPFKPQQPVIPGVPLDSRKQAASSEQSSGSPAPGPVVPPANKSLLWVSLAAAGAVTMVGLAWWAHGSSAKSAPPAAAEATPALDPTPSKPVVQLPVGPGQIVRTEEMSKAWSNKKFLFRSPYTAEDVPAMVVRLPGGELWAISLREPYGNCELEFVTDLGRLSSQYHFAAEHPMVVDPCTRAVFDLTRYGNGPNGLVRGAIVKGTSVRPPTAIEVEKQGGWIAAVRIENNR